MFFLNFFARNSRQLSSSQFSVLSSQFSVLSSRFSVLSLQSAVLGSTNQHPTARIGYGRFEDRPGGRARRTLTGQMGVLRGCSEFEKPRGRAAVAAALLRRSQHLRRANTLDHSTEMRSPVTHPGTSNWKLPEGSLRSRFGRRGFPTD